MKYKQYLKSVLSVIIAFSFIGQLLVLDVSAEKRDLEIDCVCMDKEYKIYDEEDDSNYKKEEGTDPVTGEKKSKCYVTVDLEDLVDTEDLDEEPIEADTAEGVGGVASAIGGGIWSVLSSLKEGLAEFSPSIFGGHTQKYHAFLDEEVFGKAIAKVSEFETTEQFKEFLKTQEGECTEENPKPNCVIERALCSYEKYAGVLFYQAGQNLTESTLTKANVTTDDIQTLLSVYQERDQALFEEATHAQQAMDTAIAVYAQFFQTYRLHLSFKKVIEDLVKVRNLTSYLRDLVACIPNKFVGVATTKCN